MTGERLVGELAVGEQLKSRGLTMKQADALGFPRALPLPRIDYELQFDADGVEMWLRCWDRQREHERAEQATRDAIEKAKRSSS